MYFPTILTELTLRKTTTQSEETEFLYRTKTPHCNSLQTTSRLLSWVPASWCPCPYFSTLFWHFSSIEPVAWHQLCLLGSACLSAFCCLQPHCPPVDHYLAPFVYCLILLPLFSRSFLFRRLFLLFLPPLWAFSSLSPPRCLFLAAPGWEFVLFSLPFSFGRVLIL